eukprot:Selendium_serpulae@DN6422_c3_g1_i3.p1
MKLVRGGVHEECWARRMLGTLENRGFVCACRERAGEILPAFIKKHKSDKLLFDGIVNSCRGASKVLQALPKNEHLPEENNSVFLQPDLTRPWGRSKMCCHCWTSRGFHRETEWKCAQKSNEAAVLEAVQTRSTAEKLSIR